MNPVSEHVCGSIVIHALSPENELLLCCSRTRPDAEITARIRELARSDLNWDYLFLSASQHGLLGLLYHRIQTCTDLLPPSVVEFLRQCAKRIAERNRYLTEALHQILDRFQANNIPVVPFGGPVLVGAVYGDSSLRESKNIELIIPAKHVPKAKELLLAEGYRREYTWDRYREAAEWRFLRSVGFDREDGVHVWLRGDLDPGGFAIGLDIESMKDTVMPVDVGAASIVSLSVEDLLLHLCVEIGDSILTPRLRPIVDFAWLLDGQRGMGWGRLLERSRFLGVRRRLAMALQLARDLLAVNLPESVGPLLSGDPIAGALATQLAARLFSDREITPRMSARLSARLQTRESLRDKTRILFNFAMMPTREDWALLPLPTPLYFLLKPIRILGRRARLFSTKHVAVFMPTPYEMADQMLKMAEVGPTDTVYDLGCGDGRIVILAARLHGARGVGIDLDPDRVTEAQANARKAGVEHLVKFFRQDVMEVDLSPASVVSLFLSPHANLMLRPKLKHELSDNARIVSRSHDMGDWLPTNTKLIACDGALSRIHLWRISSGANRETQ